MNRKPQLTLMLSLAGLMLSLFLTRLHFSPELTTPVCGPQSGCDQVLASRYSQIGGVPLAVFGIAYYLALWLGALAWQARGHQPRVARWATVAGVGVSALLVAVQGWSVGAFCLLCCSSALLCLLLFLVKPTPVLANPALARKLVLLSVGVALIVWIGSGWIERPRELASVDIHFGHSLGNPAAPVQVVVFADFECPYCRAIFAPVEGFAKAHPDRVWLCYRSFPLAYHRRAMAAARAAEAAADQEHYWDYAELLEQGTLGDLRVPAFRLHLDLVRFDRDRRSQGTLDRVEADEADAQRSGIRSVPAVFINRKQVATGSATLQAALRAAAADAPHA
jgi:uncharacterized membrane protein/predicted DsbA family dithiol-disulfide isomerase